VSKDRQTAAPAFRVGVVEWHCWAVDGEQQLEWRSKCGSFRAGRNRGASTCWASCQGSLVGHDYTSLRLAMIAATLARRSAAA
jgi:hypothetical protein